MAKLDAEERDHLPDEAFALAGRRYPIADESHARNALARVAQHGSPEEIAGVKRKVKAKFPGIDVDGEHKEKVAASADTPMPREHGAIPLSSGKTLMVHMPTGAMSHDHAHHVPPGSTLTVKDGSGAKEGVRKFKVGEHEPHEMGVKPTLKQTSGLKLVNEEAGHEPHLGHVAAHLEHQKALGYAPPDCDCDGGMGLSAEPKAYIFTMALDSMQSVSVADLPKTDDAGRPIHYRKAKVATIRPEAYTHRGTREKFSITPERAKEWMQNTAALGAAGIKPFLPGEHRPKFNAKDNFGYVVNGLEREGDDLFVTMALHGDDALATAAKNQRSIYIVENPVDSNGKVYPGEALHHVALTPDGNQPDLGGLMKIAASADKTIEVPVYELSNPAAGRRKSDMTPENAQKARTLLGLSADVPDDQIGDKLVERALALSADVVALSATAPKKPDAANAKMYGENWRRMRNDIVSKGITSEAQIRVLEGIFGDKNGGMSALALSACGTGDPTIFAVGEWLLSLDSTGIKLGAGTTREPDFKPIDMGNHAENRDLTLEGWRAAGFANPPAHWIKKPEAATA
jgi:hypothetical protein